jgi:hypothetical protein
VATAYAQHLHTPAKRASGHDEHRRGGGGVEGGSSPWASPGGRRGVVPPGHAERRTQNAERPETWQRPTRAPSHPRPNTPRTQDQYRRGVEGGSTPLGISRQKAERPETWQRPTRAPSHPRPNTPRAQDQYRRGVEGGSTSAEGRTPRNVATADASVSTPPAKHAKSAPPAPAGGRPPLGMGKANPGS